MRAVVVEGGDLSLKVTLRVRRRVLYNWVFALSQTQAQDKSEQWLQDMKLQVSQEKWDKTDVIFEMSESPSSS